MVQEVLREKDVQAMDIEKRIQDLETMAQEEGESIDKVSLKTFRQFIRWLKPSSEPSITLTPQNEIYTSWEEPGKKYLFRFLLNGDIRFIPIMLLL